MIDLLAAVPSMKKIKKVLFCFLRHRQRQTAKHTCSILINRLNSNPRLFHSKDWILTVCFISGRLTLSLGSLANEGSLTALLVFPEHQAAHMEGGSRVPEMKLYFFADDCAHDEKLVFFKLFLVLDFGFW